MLVATTYSIKQMLWYRHPIELTDWYPKGALGTFMILAGDLSVD
jgi:hypothetical protein